MSKSDSIILSIKPLYWEMITNGTKRFEYRRKLASVPINKIYFYVTAPVKKVMGFTQVLFELSDTPDALWERTEHASGISRQTYNCYFYGCDRCHAYGLGAIAVFENPKELSEFGLKRAPQSFAYVKEEGI